MRYQVIGSVIAVAAVVSWASVPAGGQAPAHAAPKYAPPRTPDGQPDMQGFWRHRTVGMPAYNIEGGGNEAHLILSAGCSQGVVGCERSKEALDAAVAARTAEHPNIIVDPPDGRIPFQPWAAARRDDSLANHTNGDPQYVDPQSKCFLPGVPRMAYQENNAIQVTQFPGYIVMSYEFVHAYRVIRMDGSPHVNDRVKLWMGDSRGHWEGNTLVIDVTNHNDQTWFDIIGSFHSDALHVVERWTRVADDRIDFEATIEDPDVFTRPWKIALPLMRNSTKGYEVMEMACREGVHLEHLIRTPSLGTSVN